MQQEESSHEGYMDRMTDSSISTASFSPSNKSTKKLERNSSSIRCNFTFRKPNDAIATTPFLRDEIVKLIQACENISPAFYNENRILEDIIDDVSSMSIEEFETMFPFYVSKDHAIHVTISLLVPFRFGIFKARLLPYLKENRIWLKKNNTHSSDEELLDISHIFGIDPSTADLKFLRDHLNEALTECYKLKSLEFHSKYNVANFDSTISTTTQKLKRGKELCRISLLTVQAPRSQAGAVGKLFPEIFPVVFQRYKIGKGLSGVYQVPAKSTTRHASSVQRQRFATLFEYHFDDFLKKKRTFKIMNLSSDNLTPNFLKYLKQKVPFFIGIDVHCLHDFEFDPAHPRSWTVTVFDSNANTMDIVAKAMDDATKFLAQSTFLSRHSTNPTVELDTPDDNDGDLIKFCNSRPSPTKWSQPPRINRDSTPVSSLTNTTTTNKSISQPTLDSASMRSLIVEVVTELIEPLKTMIKPPNTSTDDNATETNTDSLSDYKTRLTETEDLLRKATAAIEAQSRQLKEFETLTTNLQSALQKAEQDLAASRSSISQLKKLHSHDLDKMDETIKELTQQELYLNWCIHVERLPCGDAFDDFLEQTEGMPDDALNLLRIHRPDGLKSFQTAMNMHSDTDSIFSN